MAVEVRVNALRALQAPDGGIADDVAGAAEILRSLYGPLSGLSRHTGQLRYHDAFVEDAENWIEAGLETKPCFDRTRLAYTPPGNGQETFFVGPVLATNGPAPRGSFFEFFYAVRDEPRVCLEVERLFPHPKNKCQSVRLIHSSYAIQNGNCIVFFPENISGKTALDHQEYALFFFNKFKKIYLNLTIPKVIEIFGARNQLFQGGRWNSTYLTSQQFYAARCIWGYLHDYYHHQGPRPLDENLQLKLNWFVGLLEEIKCDCQTVLAVSQHQLPYCRELIEFVLFERMLRYPGQPDATRNFDAGTGVLLFEWLLGCGAIAEVAGKQHLSIDLEGTLAALGNLVCQIELLERSCEEAYRAKATEFVRSLLPAGTGSARFRFPRNYANVTRNSWSDPIIHFTSDDLY